MAALTPGGGLLALLAALPVLLWPGGHRRTRSVIGFGSAWLVLNAPWLLPSLLATARSTSDPTGVAVFAAAADTRLGLVLSLAGGGAIWNEDAVPATRMGWPAAVGTLLLLAFAGAGLPRLVSAWGRVTFAVTLSATLGLLLALWGAASPQSLAAVIAHVPGAGLLRDGQRLVAPLVVLLAVAAPLGVQRAGGSSGARTCAGRRWWAHCSFHSSCCPTWRGVSPGG